MKFTLTFTLLLFTHSLTQSQNLLSSLYNLESFPEEMGWGKTFIDELGDDTLIYNFIPFGGRDGVGGSQFDLRDKNGLDLKLPLTDPISIIITGDSDNELSKEASFYLNYKFLLTRYQDLDDPLTEKNFSLKNIFAIAAQYYDLDAYALVHEVLMDYDSELNYKAKQIEFFNQLAEALEIEEVDFKKISEDLTAENYSQREIEEALLDHILDEVEDYEQLTAVIYETFLEPLGEEEKISKKIDRIFYEDSVVSKIEREVMQPEIKINSSQKMFLNISDAYLVNDKESMGSFAFDHLTISVDFKNQHIIMEFENKSSQNLVFKDGIDLPPTISSNTAKINRIKLIISKEKLIYEFYPPTYYSGSETAPVFIEGER